MLKHIVNTINMQSKIYFIKKLQVYDELINEKQKILDSINIPVKEVPPIIEKKENISNNIIIEKNSKYKLEGLVEVISEINSEFNYNYEEIIKKFINYSKLFDDTKYKELINIKNKIYSLGIFNIVTKNELEQVTIIEKLISNELKNQYYLSYKKFDINNFLKILETEIKLNDPIIYIYSSDNNNYNELSKNIITINDKSILKGIKIKYHNVIYKYCLSI